MTRRDAFSDCHPAVGFLYFALVLGMGMFLSHPVCILLSILCAAGYCAQLKGGRALGRQMLFALPMMLAAALINPLFNHRGVTILAYLPSGNPLTAESAVYGVAAAGMLCAVVLWFGCYNAVMTSDKFICLFGRVVPAVSLVLTMALRFVPRFKSQLRAVAEAQGCVGRPVGRGPVRQRVKSAAAMVSILLTWSLENAVVTADSMKSRGYGLPGRTAFSIYRMDDRDKALLAWLSGCGFFLLCAWAAGGLRWSYFPAVSVQALSPVTAGAYGAYLALCLTPLALDGAEALGWRALGGEGAA